MYHFITKIDLMCSHCNVCTLLRDAMESCMHGNEHIHTHTQMPYHINDNNNNRKVARIHLITLFLENENERESTKAKATDNEMVANAPQDNVKKAI